MTARFRSAGPVGRNPTRRYISIKFTRWRHRLDVRGLVFGRVHCAMEFDQLSGVSVDSCVQALNSGSPHSLTLTGDMLAMLTTRRFHGNSSQNSNETICRLPVVRLSLTADTDTVYKYLLILIARLSTCKQSSQDTRGSIFI